MQVNPKEVSAKKATTRHPLYSAAAEAVVKNQVASVSFLKRILDVDSNTAVYLLHELQIAGIIGEFNLDHGWDVLARELPKEPTALVAQKPVAFAIFDGAWIDDHTADPIRAEQWEQDGKVVVKLYAAPVAQAGQVPDGWAIVPIEPTREMMLNGSSCQHHDHDDMSCIQRKMRHGIWSKMIAAAPAQGGE
ncbi:TPA: hypothetical protein N0H38_004475 [Pseudomonas aeruginosa]|nr:hypothetical protein [Pseudomonas aeruginosa]HCK4574088.1 hypothetical protein [Pseudomonas aeruginosa]HCK4790531.1 hypothetical protein [Pseudomonas aeruginosa]HCK4799657.1 hypothetical protein [Pseudomonas aeruginosa]HCK5645947.1 hypothetical protein [Pseudomonas aeruginosa]